MMKVVSRFIGATATVAILNVLAASAPAGASRLPIGSLAGRAPATRGIAAGAMRNLRDLGPLAAQTPVRIGLLLRYRNEAELEALVREQGDRRSRYYHRFLNTAQWNSYFAPQQSDLARTLSALRAAGFVSARVGANRSFISATAPASVVDATFSTQLHRVADGARQAIANVRAATVPASLRETVAVVSGLQTQQLAMRPNARTLRATQPVMRIVASSAASTASPASEATPGPNPDPEPTLQDGPTYVHHEPPEYGPVAMAVSYDYPVQHGYDGTGRTVANLLDGDYLDSDLASNESAFAITRTGTTTRVPVDGGDGQSNTVAKLESTLDVEAVAGLAPGANYRLYLPPVLNDYEIQVGLNQIISDDIADVVSLSYGNCETADQSLEYAESYLALQGAAKGITFVAATGDFAGLACGTDFGANLPGVLIPAASTYFTAVGGTDLAASPTDGSYVSEVGDSTSGGGTSVFEAQPDWQAATSGTAAGGRSIPDVALDDSYSLATGYQITDGGTEIPEGGTSLSTPLFAAMIAEIDQVQGSRNGWINPRLYQIVNAQGYGFAFRDIIAGSSGTSTCVPGYDQVTGIGAPLGWELAGTL